MADCPRCGKKVPDNMKFCGFCGIELETAKATTTERWMAFLQTIMADDAQVASVMNSRIMGSVAFIAGSIITAVSNFPFSSYATLVLGILGVIGICIGAWFFHVSVDDLYSIETHSRIHLMAYDGAVNGRLSTAKDFDMFISYACEKFKDDMKIMMKSAKEFNQTLFGEKEPTR
jgi:RNA polymerase subunit RPABC4/transcription elongation factor Spt4